MEILVLVILSFWRLSLATDPNPPPNFQCDIIFWVVTPDQCGVIQEHVHIGLDDERGFSYMKYKRN